MTTREFPKFSRGDEVYHDKYGYGRVIAHGGDSRVDQVVIKFGSNQPFWIWAGYPGISKVEAMDHNGGAQ